MSFQPPSYPPDQSSQYPPPMQQYRPPPPQFPGPPPRFAGGPPPQFPGQGQPPPPPGYAQSQNGFRPRPGPPFPPAPGVGAQPQFLTPPQPRPKVVRHEGPSGPDGEWMTNDLVTEPEAMLDEEQMKVWKEFDNKEIDRDGLQQSFFARLKAGTLDWAKWRRDQLKWKNLRKWIFAAVAIASLVLFIVFEDDIVNAIEPFGASLKKNSWGWLVPVAILFALSFPPLGGGEIIVLLTGIVWPILTAWGITVLGTLLGEIANYWLFRSVMRNKQRSLENKSMWWTKLSKVSREGGFWMILAIRYSVIPTHVSTTLFASIKIPFFTLYLPPTILSQPRWLLHVFLGHVYEAKVNGTETKTEKMIFAGCSIVFGILTVRVMRWLGGKQNAADEECKQELRQRRADALNAARTSPHRAAAASAFTSSPNTPPSGPKSDDARPVQPDGGVYHLEVPAGARGGHHHNASQSSMGSSSGSEGDRYGSTAYLNKPPEYGMVR